MPIEVLSEVVYVLKGVYGISREVIHSKLLYFFENFSTIIGGYWESCFWNHGHPVFGL